MASVRKGFWLAKGRMQILTFFLDRWVTAANIYRHLKP